MQWLKKWGLRQKRGLGVSNKVGDCQSIVGTPPRFKVFFSGWNTEMQSGFFLAGTHRCHVIFVGWSTYT